MMNMHGRTASRSGMRTMRSLALVLALVTVAVTAFAQQPPGDDGAALAKKLSNPIASLISVPVKLDWDTGIGQAGADRFTVVVQPVFPLSLNNEWNLITRTIIPFA